MTTNEPPLPVVMTTTNELFLPSRIHYRVMDRVAVLGKFRSLRCMNLEPCGRWTWLYENEARELGFPATYDELPPESQPLVLASVYWIEPDRLHVYVRSTPRLGKFLEFFDRHISRRHAIAEFVDAYNVLTVQAPSRPIAKPEEFFRDESKIVLTDLESIGSRLGGPNELAGWLKTRTLAPLERHPLTAFYEDGAEHMVFSARLREILAMKQRGSPTPIRPVEVLNDLLGQLDSSGGVAPERQRSGPEAMAPASNRETRANAPADTGDSPFFKFSFLESNRSRQEEIFKIASASGSIERFTVQYDCCRNPVCDCRTLDFWFQPSTDPHDAARANDIEFKLDDRQVRCSPPKNAMQERLARELRARLTPADWVLADRIYRSIKESVSDPEDAGDLDVKFPEEVLSDPSALMHYHRVFPNASRSHFQCAGRSWFTIDRYCTRPDCDCREVVLDIAEVPESSGIATVQVKVKDTATLFFDYTTGRARVKADGPAGWPPGLELFAALRAADPDLDVRAQRRQRVLRQLHRRVRRDMVESMRAQPVRPLKKVGRNEKCPCGSGKKHKVCCGR